MTGGEPRASLAVVETHRRGDSTTSTVTALRSTRWPLMSRDDEVDQIKRLLDRGATNCCVLFGGAGEGKTRVLAEVARCSGERGMDVARVSALRALQPIPLGALSPLLEAGPGPNQNDRESQHQSPFTQSRFADSPFTQSRFAQSPFTQDWLSPNADAERHATLRRAARTLAGTTTGTGRLLVVDDAHCLDEVSAIVVYQLAMEADACVLVAVRRGEPAPGPIVSLWKDGLASRMDLRPFTRLEVGDLLEAVLGTAVEQATVRRLHAVSEGNPLYLRELVIGAIENGVMVGDHDVWRLRSDPRPSDALADLVESRLDELSGRESDALEVLAVGEVLDHALFTEVADAEVLDGLEHKGLVSVVAGRSGRLTVRLSRTVFGEIIRARMSPLRRRKISGRLASAVESDPEELGTSLLRAAVWRLDGGGTLRTSLVLDAARQAHLAFDHRLAERLLQAAWSQEPTVPVGLLLSEVLVALGRHEQTNALLVDVHKLDCSPQEWVTVAIARATTLFWGLGRAEDARAVLTDAIASVTAGPRHQELVGYRATLEMLGGSPRAALELTVPVLADAGDRALVQLAVAAGPSFAISGRMDLAAEIAHRALAVGPREHLAPPWIHRVTLALAACMSGEVGEAAAIAQLGYDQALEVQDRTAHAWFSLMLGYSHLLAGQVRSAARLFSESEVLFYDLGFAAATCWCVAGRALAFAFTGERVVVQRALEQVEHQPEGPILMMHHTLDRARAWCSYILGKPQLARQALETAARDAESKGALAVAAECWHDLGRLGGSEAALPRLHDLAETIDGPLMAARVLHVRGLIEHDVELLRRAGDLFRDLGMLLLAAEVAGEEASCFRRIGDARKAEEALHRSTTLTDRCEGARTPALLSTNVDASKPLTTRQRDIAWLAASRLPTKVIAKRLSLSPRTVDNHLQQVYAKVGVSSRSELADLLERTPDLFGAQ